MGERVTVSVQGGVADVRLNRPEKLNALDGAMFEALVAAGDGLKNTPGLRAVVLSGEGRSFSAGLDFANFAAATAEEGQFQRFLARGPESPANYAQRAAWVWREVPVPVIAAVHGVAFGGGLQIALAADIRIAAPDARLSVMEIKWGLVPDLSGTQTLRHLVRLDVAKELTYTGRIVSGAEAAAMGLVTRVADDPRSAAFELASEIAGKSPEAIRAGKRLLDAAVVGDYAAGLLVEEQSQLALLGGANQLEAVQANLEKRTPLFIDLA